MYAVIPNAGPKPSTTEYEVYGLMARIVEREVVPVETTDGGSNTASNFIWALALIIIVALIVFGVWKSGLLRQLNSPAPAQKINVEVQGH